MEQAEHLIKLREAMESRPDKTTSRYRRGGNREIRVPDTYGHYTVAAGYKGWHQWNCHSSLDRLTAVNPIFLWSQLGDIGTTEGADYGPKDEYLGIVSEHQRAFLEWFIKNSPWSPVLADFNPDIDWAIKHGLVFGNIDTLPANFVFNAVCASRFPTEFRLACRMWYEMAEAGACPRVAFALTSLNGWDGGQGHNNAHSAIASGFITAATRYEYFAKEGKPDLSGLPYTKGGRGTPTNIIWDMPNSPRFDPYSSNPVTINSEIARLYNGVPLNTYKNDDFIKIALLETERLKG